MGHQPEGWWDIVQIDLGVHKPSARWPQTPAVSFWWTHFTKVAAGNEGGLVPEESCRSTCYAV